jgi:hypothetical protein
MTVTTSWKQIAAKGGRHAAERLHETTPYASDDRANSFIEDVGVGFARQMLDAGVDGKAITEALDILVGTFADRLAVLEGAVSIG